MDVGSPQVTAGTRDEVRVWRRRRTGGGSAPPLTERRKAATRLEIAREAVRLFAAQGVAATTADEIAAAAGISPRTLWRYCSSRRSASARC
ncbi:TetR/AcrR family transcriptional regulator [Actinomadura keratinilytica]